MIQAFTSLPGEEKNRLPAIADTIRSGLDNPMLGKSQGLMTGLINTLPSERRRDVFKMPVKEQLETLRAEMPADPLKAGFSAKRMGYPGPVTHEGL